MLPPLKNYQTKALEQAKLRIEQVTPKAWVLCAPTGAGKTLLMIHLILWAAKVGIPVILYTNRRMLLEQTAEELKNAGIAFGVRADGYSPEFGRSCQLAMLQTRWGIPTRTYL
jgi:superfamily II DNA or RNA helicase